MKKKLTVFTLFSILVLLVAACATNDKQDKNKESENHQNENVNKQQEGDRNENGDKQKEGDLGNGQTDSETDDQVDTTDPSNPKDITSFTLNWNEESAKFSANGINLGDARESVQQQLGDPHEIFEENGYTIELYMIEDWFTRELALTYQDGHIEKIEIFGSLDEAAIEQLIEDFTGEIYSFRFASYFHLFNSSNENILIVESSNYAKYGVQNRYIITTMSHWTAAGNYLEDYRLTDKKAAKAKLVYDNPLNIHLNATDHLVVNSIKLGDKKETVISELGEPWDAVEDKNYEDQQNSDHGYWPHWTYYYSFETERNTITLVIEFYQDQIIAIDITDKIGIGLLPRSYIESFNGYLFSNNPDDGVYFVDSEEKYVIQAGIGQYRIAERADRNWINTSFEDMFEKVEKETVLKAAYIRE
jgi:hypothetical protein